MNGHQTSTGTRLRFKRLCGLAIAAFACAGAFWYGVHTDEAYPLTQSLTVDQKYLNFGTVWEQAEFAWVLPIQNQGESEIEIVRFASSCPCVTRIEPASFMIPPRNTASVRVTMNLVGGTEKKGQEGDSREFTIRIVPDVRNAERSHRGWAITGKTREATRLSSRQITFWDDIVRGQTAPTRGVDLSSVVSLKRLSIKYDPTLLKVETIQIPPNTEQEKCRAFRVNITPTAVMPSGPFSEDFTIEPVCESGEKLPAWSVKVIGTMVEAIQAFPTILEFGVVPLGEIRKAIIFLRSKAGNEFDVEKTETTTDSVSIEHQTTGPSELAFEIAQKAVALGSQCAEIRFSVRDHEMRTFSVTVKANYYGTAQKYAAPRKMLGN